MYVIACELTFMANKIVDDTIYKIAVCLHICHRTFNSCLNTQTRKKIAAIDLEDSKNDQKKK